MTELQAPSGERLARLEATAEHLATKEDVQKLRADLQSSLHKQWYGFAVVAVLLIVNLVKAFSP